MAEASSATNQQSGNGSDTRKTALRAAAIAAASGATAIAAKRAFSDRGGSQSGGGTSKKQTGSSSAKGGTESMLTSVVGSSWNAVRDSVVPFAEEAANAAGEYLGRNGPDFVRDTIVPSFIEGFQNAQKQSAGDE